MAIRIEKLADVTLSAQAVAGGSLLADTTYYVTVIFQRANGFREGQPVANMTNEVEVLTTSVNKSIQLNYSHTVNILSFADEGGGVVRITTDGLHCMLANDQITIAGTTNYNGDYSVSYDVADVDGTDAPNTFRITHVWDGDDGTGTATNDTENVIGSNNYMTIRCSVEQGYIDGEWDWTIMDNSNGWIGPGYSAVAAVQGYTLTTQPTTNGLNVVDYMPYFRRTATPTGVTDMDRPYMYITGDVAWSDIIAAMETWLPNNTNYFNNITIISQVETLYFRGYLHFGTLSSIITVEADSITIDGSVHGNSPTHVVDYLKWNYVNFKQIGGRRPYICGTFYRCAFRDECGDSPGYYFAKFEQTTLLPSSNITFYGTTSGIWDGGSITLSAINRYFWYVYPDIEDPQTRVQNLTLYTGYFYLHMPYHDNIVNDDTHFMENVKIYSGESTRDLYLYQTTNHTITEVLNVTAPLQTNGIVRCRRSTIGIGEFRFYFSVSFHMIDPNGDDLVGATLTLKNASGVEVSDTTDIDGNVSLNIESYRNIVNDSVLGEYVDYNPFLLTVEMDGYQTYREVGLELYDKIDKTIAMIVTAAETALIGSTIYGSTIY